MNGIHPSMCVYPLIYILVRALLTTHQSRHRCEVMASFPESLSKINQLVSGTFSLSSQHHSQLIYNVPCAYVDPRVQDECLKPGIQACSACRLVKYCSKVAQKGVPYSWLMRSPYRNASASIGKYTRKVCASRFCWPIILSALLQIARIPSAQVLGCPHGLKKAVLLYSSVMNRL